MTKEFDMLGTTIDNKLKFDNHVTKICRKVSQQMAVLKRMKKMLPFETRRDLYLAFILPHFNYCSETWNFCSKSAADKLERLNERAIRFVFRDKYTSYSELLSALGLSSLKQQRLSQKTKAKNVDTQQAFIMNDETQQTAIQTFPEENVLS